MVKRLAVFLAVLTLWPSGVVGQAQTLCALSPNIAFNALYSAYGERPVAKFQSGNVEIHILVNEETGTVTILKKDPNGVTCILAAGESWLVLHRDDET